MSSVQFALNTLLLYVSQLDHCKTFLPLHIADWEQKFTLWTSVMFHRMLWFLWRNQNIHGEKSSRWWGYGAWGFPLSSNPHPFWHMSASPKDLLLTSIHVNREVLQLEGGVEVDCSLSIHVELSSEPGMLPQPRVSIVGVIVPPPYLGYLPEPR
jgi:hypothetical protein